MIHDGAADERDAGRGSALDQLLALVGETFGVELVSFVDQSGETRWVSSDLPPGPLPVCEAHAFVRDATIDPSLSTHPLVRAGLRSFIAHADAHGTLWLASARSAAFHDDLHHRLERWSELARDLAFKTCAEAHAFRRFARSVSQAVVSIHGDRIFLNPAAERLTGFKTDELRTLDDWFRAAYGEAAPSVRALYELDRKQGFDIRRTISFVSRDGTRRMLEFTAGRDGEHELWFLSDVTEHVASEARFRVLFDQSSTALTLSDELGVIDCNPAALALLGYTARAQVLHRSLLEVSPESQPDGRSSATHLAEMERIAREHGSHRFDWFFRTATGEAAKVEVTLTPLELGARRVLLAEMHDISKRLEYEKHLEQARDAALAFGRARSDFLATMSHEIRTPMNGVIGMTQLLLETGLTDQQREYVRTVRSCGEGLLALINDILDFSRLEAGKVQLESIPFSVREVVEDAAAVIAPQAHVKRLELTCTVTSDVPGIVWGDPTRVRQVLINLLSNAVKFTSTGGVQIAVTVVDGQLRVSVRDSGIGISPEALPRLFSAFSQADASTTRRFGGSGLGLVICRGLTQLMGGTIEVESDGSGSTFSVALPLRLHTQGIAVPNLRGHTVAVLERRPLSRAALLALLEPTGVTVLTPDRAEDSRVAELVLVDQGFDEDDAGLASRLAKEGNLVGLVRRLDGSTLEETAVTFVLSAPVRSHRLYQHLERLLLRTRAFESGPSFATRRQYGARVLVAEDNRVNQRVVRGLLERLGCEVTIVENGAAAVDTIAQRPFDLVFMDCQMPELDGFAATQRIRATQVRHVPIVALTAGVMDGERERCLAAGMDEFLKKPVRLEDLDRALDQWVGVTVAG